MAQLLGVEIVLLIRPNSAMETQNKHKKRFVHAKWRERSLQAELVIRPQNVLRRWALEPCVAEHHPRARAHVVRSRFDNALAVQEMVLPVRRMRIAEVEDVCL